MRLSENTMVISVVFDPDGTRLVTTFHGHPFYQSTGTSSNAKGTWFPFNGFQEKEVKDTDTPSGYLIKPSCVYANYYLLSLWLSKKFVENYSREMTQHEVTLGIRFGGFDGMCISYLLGGGFWDTEVGKNVGQWIRADFRQLLLALSHEVNAFRNHYPEVIPVVDFSKKEKSDITTVNQWLMDKTDRKYAGDDLVFNIGYTAILPCDFDRKFFINRTPLVDYNKLLRLHWSESFQTKFLAILYKDKGGGLIAFSDIFAKKKKWILDYSGVSPTLSLVLERMLTRTRDSQGAQKYREESASVRTLIEMYGSIKKAEAILNKDKKDTPHTTFR